MNTNSWGPLPDSWRRDLTEVVTSKAEAQRAGAPVEWQELLGTGCVERVQAAWASTTDTLPLFNDYLRLQLDDLAVGVGAAGPVLLYRFRDWIDDGDGFCPGVMVAGLPMSEVEAKQVERTFGQPPPGLSAVWSRHSFVQLKNGSMLVQPESAKLLQTADHDYLAFVDSWSDLPTCLQRPRGASHWSDHVVVFAPGRSVARAGVSPTVDSLLVDWALGRWPAEVGSE